MFMYIYIHIYIYIYIYIYIFVSLPPPRMADPVRSIDLDEEVLSITMSPDDRFVATCGTGLVAETSAGRRGPLRVVDKGACEDARMHHICFISALKSKAGGLQNYCGLLFQR